MSGTEQRGRRGRLPAVVLAVLLVLAGAVAVGVAVRAQTSPPQPQAAAQATTAAPPSDASTAVPAPPAPRRPPVPRGSRPRPAGACCCPPHAPPHLEVPAIGVSSDLLDLGLNPDGTLEVPPLAEDSEAGWFHGSPTPGELGPAVLLGHVDSAEYGPGIFFDLGDLHPGDEITVTRADGTDAVFAVDQVTSYPKASFPTLEVYGNTDHAALRLITCGGQFDASTRNYLDNIVVYASLVTSHPA